MRPQQWQRALLLIAGAWMLGSPWFIPSYQTAEPVGIWASHAVGLVLLALGGIALVRPKAWMDWVGLAIAGWLIAAPMVLTFSSISGGAASNHILAGIFVGLISLALIARHRGDASPRHVQQH